MPRDTRAIQRKWTWAAPRGGRDRGKEGKTVRRRRTTDRHFIRREKTSPTSCRTKRNGVRGQALTRGMCNLDLKASYTPKTALECKTRVSLRATKRSRASSGIRWTPSARPKIASQDGYALKGRGPCQTTIKNRRTTCSGRCKSNYFVQYIPQKSEMHCGGTQDAVVAVKHCQIAHPEGS